MNELNGMYLTRCDHYRHSSTIQQVEKYRSIARDIENNRPRVVEMPLLRLQMDELHKYLATRANDMSGMFLEKIIEDVAKVEKK